MHIVTHIQYMQILVQGIDVQYMNYLIKGLIMTTKNEIDATELEYIGAKDIKLMFAVGCTQLIVNKRAYDSMSVVNKHMLKVCRVKVKVI